MGYVGVWWRANCHGGGKSTISRALPASANEPEVISLWRTFLLLFNLLSLVKVVNVNVIKLLYLLSALLGGGVCHGLALIRLPPFWR